MVSISTRDFESFNEAVADAVHNSGVPVKQLAAQIDLAPSTLYNCANPNMDEPCLPRKKIIPLTLATGSFAILDHFERACGRVAYELPVVRGSFSEVATEVSAVTAEFGELLQKVAEALKDDGQVDRLELKAIKTEAADLHRALARLIAVAESEAGEG